MNAITQALLAGAALGALATAQAIAGNVPYFGITALHAGNVVHKTRMAKPGCGAGCTTHTTEHR